MTGAIESAGQFVGDPARAEQHIRELEQALAQAAQFAAVGLLLRSFLHELSSPLGAILLYGDLLAQRSTEPYVAERLERIQEAGRRCRQIVQRLFEIAHPAPRMPSRLALAELVDDALAMLGGQLASHGLSVETAFDSAIPQFLGDRAEFSLAILHLLAHVVRSLEETGAGSRIVIRGQVEPAAPAADGSLVGEQWVRLTISGGSADAPSPNAGMTPPSAGGLNLGLMAAGEVVERHGGRLKAEVSSAGAWLLTVEVPTGDSAPSAPGQPGVAPVE